MKTGKKEKIIEVTRGYSQDRVSPYTYILSRPKAGSESTYL